MANPANSHAVRQLRHPCKVRIGDRIGARRIDGTVVSETGRSQLRLLCVHCGTAMIVPAAKLDTVSRRCHVCRAGESKPRFIEHLDMSSETRAHRIAICEVIREEYGCQGGSQPWDECEGAQIALAMLGSLTLAEMGVLMDLSRERIRQIEAGALAKGKRVFVEAGYTAEDARDKPTSGGETWLGWAGRL